MMLSSTYRNNSLLVALSGGCDSVALLLMLLEQGCHVEAAHCNFNLRGEESRRDEEFVRQLCRERGVRLHVAHFDTRSYAELHHLSIETAARNLRYSYFEQLRRDLHLDFIAVAHHRDDQAETVLMHLLRGSGLHGLTGMQPISGHIVRPLLGYSRQQLEDYLREKGQTFVTDSTNLERDATRNRIRLDVLPLLNSIYPGATEAITRCAAHLTDAEKVIDRAVADALSESSENSENSDNSEGSGLSESPCALSLDRIRSFPAPSLLLHEWLAPLGFTPAQTENIAERLDAQTGTTWQSATHTLTIHHGSIIVGPTAPPFPPFTAPETGLYALPDGRHLRISTEAKTPDFTPSRSANVITLDADSVRFPLTLRTAQPADRFQPFGMKGTKLVSDYLTDRHIPLPEKRRQLVLTQQDGTIIWLVGHRTAHNQRVGDHTGTILRVELEK